MLAPFFDYGHFSQTLRNKIIQMRYHIIKYLEWMGTNQLTKLEAMSGS